MACVSIKKLRYLLDQTGSSTLSVEREAGLKRNTIHNILQGKSKMPHRQTVMAICRALKCQPKDLIVENEETKFHLFPKEEEADISLFSLTVQGVAKKVEELGLPISYSCLTNTIRTVYQYSKENDLGETVDQNFIHWIVKKNLGL